MTKIVRERPEMEVDEDIVRFQVCMSLKDKKTVLGVWEHAYRSGARQVILPTPPFGPVEQGFEEAKSYAEQKWPAPNVCANRYVSPGTVIGKG